MVLPLVLAPLVVSETAQGITLLIGGTALLLNEFRQRQIPRVVSERELTRTQIVSEIIRQSTLVNNQTTTPPNQPSPYDYVHDFIKSAIKLLSDEIPDNSNPIVIDTTNPLRPFADNSSASSSRQLIPYMELPLYSNGKDQTVTFNPATVKEYLPDDLGGWIISNGPYENGTWGGYQNPTGSHTVRKIYGLTDAEIRAVPNGFGPGYYVKGNRNIPNLELWGRETGGALTKQATMLASHLTPHVSTPWIIEELVPQWTPGSDVYFPYVKVKINGADTMPAPIPLVFAPESTIKKLFQYSSTIDNNEIEANPAQEPTAGGPGFSQRVSFTPAVMAAVGRSGILSPTADPLAPLVPLPFLPFLPAPLPDPSTEPQTEPQVEPMVLPGILPNSKPVIVPTISQPTTKKNLIPMPVPLPALPGGAPLPGEIGIDTAAPLVIGNHGKLIARPRLPIVTTDPTATYYNADKAPILGKSGGGSIASIAAEVEKLEKKGELLLNAPPPALPSDLTDILQLVLGPIRDLVKSLMDDQPGGEYTLIAPCEINPETMEPNSYSASWDDTTDQFGAIIGRLDAIASLVQIHKDVKQPVCNSVQTVVPFNNVTVTAWEVVTPPPS